MKFPDEFQLSLKEHYFENPNDPDAMEYVAQRNELSDSAARGELFVKFIGGDRKGSIARLTIDPKYGQQPRCLIKQCSWSSYNEQAQFQVEWYFFSALAKWDKPKRSCQVTLPDANIVFLPNYAGPTIYEVFDRKAAKQELLANPDQRDIDGNLLAIGDKVLYINARYGSGFELCHGTIKEFKVSADSSGHSFSTIVQLDGDDMESSISYPSQMIYRK